MVIPTFFASGAQNSLRLLMKVCSFSGKQIHVLLDKYVTPSRKVNERMVRGADDTRYTITGPEQMGISKMNWQNSF